MTRPCFLMIDGVASGPSLPERNAVVVAERVSFVLRGRCVATCRLGDARSLRRCEAGREVKT